MSADVTVVIPTIPPRARLLGRAIASVAAQTRPARTIVVEHDLGGAGAWTTRNRGLVHVRSEWTAFLDDDDELLPHHLEQLLALAADTGAGLVWGWFDVIGGIDPFPQHRGRPFDPDAPHIVPITYLVRTDVLFAAMVETGGFAADNDGAWDNQDAPLFTAAARIGGTACTPDVTWLWHHHRANTSGLPERWHPHPEGRTAAHNA